MQSIKSDYNSPKIKVKTVKGTILADPTDYDSFVHEIKQKSGLENIQLCLIEDNESILIDASDWPLKSDAVLSATSRSFNWQKLLLFGIPACLVIAYVLRK